MSELSITAKTPKSAVGRELSTLNPLQTFRGLNVYTFRGADLPSAMQEVGRLRETIFRKHGAGRGGQYDLDELDFGTYPYMQMIAFDPAEEEIVATYRYQWGSWVEDGGKQVLRTSSLFNYSDDFSRNKLPYAVELGRSVVNDKARRKRFGLFALWKGIVELINLNPELRYYFGNVTLYKTMNKTARDKLITYLETHYPPPEPMLQAKRHLHYKPRNADAGEAVENGMPDTPENRIQTLRTRLSPFGESIPPILQSYMSLSTNIWFGEAAMDKDFGDALEMGIIVPVTENKKANLSRFG